MLSKISKFLEGKKTFIVAILVGVTAALQYSGVVIPEYVFTILGAFGLGFLRAGVAGK